MSISANYPNVFPSLELNFAQGQQLDPRVTFSRSTTAPYYDGKTSVLAEQNLLLNSQIFTSIWATNSTITGNTTTAPDGTTTASTFLTPAGLVNPFVTQVTPITNAIPYTFSASLKYLTNQFAFLKIYGNTGTGSWGIVVVDLINGTITSTQNGSSATVNATSIVAQPNGFYRVSVTVTQSGGSATTGCGGYIQLSNTGTPTIANYGNYTWTALGTESIYIWGAQLEQRSSATAYNATTTTALTNYIPQLLTAPINAPRFDFNPTTGESLGLLIEQSSTNLLTYSQDFSNAVWTKANTTITTGANIAPDGTQTMSKLVEDATTNYHNVNYSYALTAGTFTFSICSKQGERKRIIIRELSTSGNGAIFDLSTGTVVNNLASGIGSIILVGNGVYRCSVVGTETTGTRIYGVYLATDTTTTVVQANYTGNGYSGIYIWGAQLEALAFPTSYIPTTSAQVTRAADVAPLPTSGWYNIAQGTWYSEFIPMITTGTSRAILQTNNYSMYLHTSGAISIYDGTNGALNGTATNNALNKATTLYAQNTLISCLNGIYPTTTSAYNNIFASATTLTISGSNLFNGRIKKLASYPQALTSAQLQALTGS